MKRKDIVTKLMTEGFSEKTLSTMTDKQLSIMISRVLPEQYQSTSQTQPVNVSRTDTNTITQLKQQKKPFATYEGEVKEEELLGKGPKKPESDKSLVIKRSNAKIKQAIKDGKPYTDYVRAIKHVNNGEVPDSTKKIISKEDMNEIRNLVNKIVESKMLPFTSKNEIMEMIHMKMNEQTETMTPMPKTKSKPGHNGIPEFMTYDEIMNAAEPATAPPVTKPGTKPGTRPGTTPTKRPNPYQPGPGINPAPKAMAKKI